MNLTIHSSFLPHTDPEASLAFYRDTLGFEVRLDVGYEGMRWITVGPPDQPDTAIVLHPPTATPGLTDDERRTIVEMMAKGTFATLLLATHDLDGTFEKVQAGDEVDVAGSETLQVYLEGVALPFDTGQTEASTDLTPRDTRVVREVDLSGTFEGRFTAFVGLDRRLPFRVYRLSSPTRVVVDVRHR